MAMGRCAITSQPILQARDHRSSVAIPASAAAFGCLFVLNKKKNVENGRLDMDCQDWQCQAACRTTSACMQDMQAVIAVGSPSTSYYFLSVHTYEHRLALVGDARLNAQTRAVVGSLEESRLHCRPRGKQSVAGVMEGTHGDALGGVPVEQLQDRAPEGAKAPPHLGA